VSDKLHTYGTAVNRDPRVYPKAELRLLACNQYTGLARGILVQRFSFASEGKWSQCATSRLRLLWGVNR